MILNKAVIVLGFMILIVGGGIAVYNYKVRVLAGYMFGNPYYEWVRIHPYAIPGLIIALLGFVTMCIGGALPDEEKKAEKRCTFEEDLKFPEIPRDACMCINIPN